MNRGRPEHPVILLSCAIALALAGCASSGAQSQSTVNSPPVKPVLVSSPAMGLVGLLLMDPFAGPPRAAGMKGLIVGYIVSHPDLPSDLSIRGADGHARPVLAFKLDLVVVRSAGTAGLEDLRGRGNLEVFYKPDGFDGALPNYAGAIESSQAIESDDIEFDGRFDFDTYRFYLRVKEIAIETRAFTFAGRTRRTPPSRIAWDVLVGEFSDGFFGLPVASNTAMPQLSPEEKLIALVGPPHRAVRY